MSIHVALHHRTSYSYDRPINLGPQVVRLRPAPHCRTRIVGYSLDIEPKQHFLNWQQDPQSNYLARLVFPEKTKEFSVTVTVVAEMSVFNPFDFFLEPAAEKFPFEYDRTLDHELAPFRLKCDLTPRFLAYLADVRTDILGKAYQWKASSGTPDPRQRTIDFLVAINQKVSRDVDYLIRLEPGVQTPEHTLTTGSGSCRDSAWLLCQVLRHSGLAARFVSGYLIQLAPDVKSLDGPSGPEKDFTDLHAWCEVYLPGAGWVGLDATSGLMAGEGHIPLACAPDPTSAAPITGAVDECEVTFDFDMHVTRVHESARVTKPYTDEEWAKIEALGHQVDADLKKHDVRLTMGGEPTFVSIDDYEGAEWNTTAMGPMKRLRSEELLRRLQTRFAPGGFLHHGQGKWYPGEQLPRWSFGCYWRKDGQPIWDDITLIADANKDYGMTNEDSERFIKALASRLEVDSQWILPGYEDTLYYLWREKCLPVNVDPLRSNLEDEMERDRLTRVFSAGLGTVVGHVLPLQRGSADGWKYWASGPWFLRQERLCLIPGDSPMGLRLPLDGLPYVSKNDYPYVNEVDPLVPRPPLPSRPPYDPQRFTAAGFQTGGASILFQNPNTGKAEEGTGREADERERGGGTTSAPAGSKAAPNPALSTDLRDDTTRPPLKGQSTPWIVRTALCVEPRDGRLHVFMPPVEKLEDYLDIVSAVEDTARLLQTPVLIEGYTPPYDPRLQVLKVTPDPGVIEVNVQPADSWDEMVSNTTILYEEARNVRLGTEKFMVDGRHTGTGGGNHIVFGGETPSDSPLLRRPDLLRSLITYWQHHPALSYLFSGLFVGPTSQAPRVDEARNDILYELEVAFQQVPAFTDVPPWLVDRVFRNLLTDLTGNTHRAEFCIDKLYSPDSTTGRLGLLELRAFEMPPHARMSLTQQLLLRALLARFWKEPYEKPLVRWGTELHDRWMLPHFLWQDIEDVTKDMQAAGYPIQAEWFAAHHDFRFPYVGDQDVRGLHLELRHALEPWHVLGEEGGAGGTVRFVDSSVERIQVKVSGAIDTRHSVLCNGVAIPLQPTGTNGEYVAAVRYRAWQPSSCLHPTVGVHAPLTF
ncbi:MAG: dehydrogenase, partial [Verrucomicrobiaceae bacterium]|nr:dehydrogenase [Verrucomicrobiaceae bacterium]